MDFKLALRHTLSFMLKQGTTLMPIELISINSLEVRNNCIIITATVKGEIFHYGPYSAHGLWVNMNSNFDGYSEDDVTNMFKQLGPWDDKAITAVLTALDNLNIT